MSELLNEKVGGIASENEVGVIVVLADVEIGCAELEETQFDESGIVAVAAERILDADSLSSIEVLGFIPSQ